MELDFMQQEAEKWIPIKTHGLKKTQGLHYLIDLENPIVECYFGDLPDYLSTPHDTRSRTFKILNQYGEQVYYVFEYKSEKAEGCCKRKCINQTYHFTNRLGGTVFHFSHSCRRDRVTVYCNDTEPLGTIAIPTNSWCKKPCYSIVDSDNNPQFDIVGSVDSFMRRCFCCKPSYKTFKIQTTATKGNPSKLFGEITSRFLGMKKKNSVSVDGAGRGRFGLSFPAYMTVQMKAMIIAASFLIQEKYFDLTRLPPPEMFNADTKFCMTTMGMLQSDIAPTVSRGELRFRSWVRTPPEQETPVRTPTTISKPSSKESSVDVRRPSKMSVTGGIGASAMSTVHSSVDSYDDEVDDMASVVSSVSNMMKDFVLPFTNN